MISLEPRNLARRKDTSAVRTAEELGAKERLNKGLARVDKGHGNFRRRVWYGVFGLFCPALECLCGLQGWCGHTMPPGGVANAGVR